jgi:hypothetical protein
MKIDLHKKCIGHNFYLYCLFIIELNGISQYGEGESLGILHQDQGTPVVYGTPHRKV